MTTRSHRVIQDASLRGKLSATQPLGTLTPRVEVTNEHNSGQVAQSTVRLLNKSTGTILYVENASSGIAHNVANQGAGYGIQVANSSTGRGISATNSAAGSAAHFENSGAGRAALFRTTAAATGYGLALNHMATNASSAGAFMYDQADKSVQGSLFKLGHYGPGYANETHNYPGAGTPLVIHQYSEASGQAGIWLDNCGAGAGIRVWNTENTTLAPGQLGTGKFLEFKRRPATGQPVEDCYYVSGEGVQCNVPKAAAPATLADGMIWVEGTGEAQVLKVRLNGVTKTVTVS